MVRNLEVPASPAIRLAIYGHFFSCSGRLNRLVVLLGYLVEAQLRLWQGAPAFSAGSIPRMRDTRRSNRELLNNPKT